MLKLTDKVDYVIDGEMLDWYLDRSWFEIRRYYN